MIISRDKESIFTDLKNKTQKFTINSSPKAFHILMDGLYSNKIKSIVRELSSNAYDAHIEAGIDKPFKITAPTLFVPTFSIRDYGNSMDHEFIMELYSSVFYSSKDTSNEQVGTFGLGSKSPFSYADAFTVETYQNGIKNSYSCHLDEDRAPNIVHIITAQTTEPDGTFVTFEVSSKDVKLFEDAIRFASAAYWRAPPIVDNLEIKALIPNYFDVRLDYLYLLSNLIIYGHPAKAIYFSQGNVWYPIPQEYLNNSYNLPTYKNDNKLASTETYESLHWITVPYNRMVILEVPLGTFNVTPSRESISLDKHSIANINKWIAEKREHVKEIIADLHAKSKTRLAGYQTYLGLRDCGISVHMIDAEYKDFKGSSHPIKNLSLIPDHFKNLPQQNSFKIGEIVPGMLYSREQDSVSSKWRPVKLFTYPTEQIHLWTGIDEKIIRKSARLRQAYSVYNSSTCHNLVCCRQDVARFVRILGLQPSQVTNIDSIPDLDKAKVERKQSLLKPNELFIVSVQRACVSSKDPYIPTKIDHTNVEIDSVRRFWRSLTQNLGGADKLKAVNMTVVPMYWENYAGDNEFHIWEWAKKNIGLDSLATAMLQPTGFASNVISECGINIWPSLFSILQNILAEEQTVLLSHSLITINHYFPELNPAIEREIERRKKENTKVLTDLMNKYPILSIDTNTKLVDYLRGNKCNT